MYAGQVYVWLTINVFTFPDFYVKFKKYSQLNPQHSFLTFQKKIIKLLFLLFHAEL